MDIYYKKIFISLSLIFFLFYSVYSFEINLTPGNQSTVNNLSLITISANPIISDNTSTLIGWGTSLVGYWNFDHRSGSTIYDLSPNSRSGSVLDGATIESSNTIRGEYLNVNNVGDREQMRVIHIAAYDLNRFSISAWNYLTAENLGTNEGHNMIFSKGHRNSEPYRSYGMGFDTDNNRYFCEAAIGGTRRQLYSSDTYSPNTGWRHIVCTYDRNYFRIYINGIEQNNASYTSTITNSLNTNNIRLGIHIEANDAIERSFIGYIDEVALFSGAITQNQILALYNSSYNLLEINVTSLTNETNYTYLLYSINSSGDFSGGEYWFFTNTSFISSPTSLVVITQENIFPIMSSISLIFTVFIIIVSLKN